MNTVFLLLAFAVLIPLIVILVGFLLVNNASKFAMWTQKWEARKRERRRIGGLVYRIYCDLLGVVIFMVALLGLYVVQHPPFLPASSRLHAVWIASTLLEFVLIVGLWLINMVLDYISDQQRCTREDS
ncbi:hypothetical protein LLG46_12465 [bacterium]|nr:hypothetical protein [bacterium]